MPETKHHSRKAFTLNDASNLFKKQEAFENPDEIFISPSRTYVVHFKMAGLFSPAGKHSCKTVVSENFSNDIEGAKSSFHAKYGWHMNIEYCEPYEYYEKRTIGILSLNGDFDKIPLSSFPKLPRVEVTTYLDTLDVPSLAELLKGDIKDYLNSLEILEQLRNSLADYYGKKPSEIKNEELPELLGKLETECVTLSLRLSRIALIINEE